MTDAKDVQLAIRSSTELMESGKYDEALTVLDAAINASRISGRGMTYIRTLCHHAAVIADFAGNPERVKGYYQQSLNLDPENPRALFGLARVYQEQGDGQAAMNFARRCRDAINKGPDTENRSFLQLIAKRWPELADTSD